MSHYNSGLYLLALLQSTDDYLFEKRIAPCFPLGMSSIEELQPNFLVMVHLVFNDSCISPCNVVGLYLLVNHGITISRCMPTRVRQSGIYSRPTQVKILCATTIPPYQTLEIPLNSKAGNISTSLPSFIRAVRTTCRKYWYVKWEKHVTSNYGWQGVLSTASTTTQALF